MVICIRSSEKNGEKTCTVGLIIPWYTNLCSPVPIRKVPRMKKQGNTELMGTPNCSTPTTPVSHLDPDMPGTNYRSSGLYWLIFTPAFILFLISTQVRFVQLANKVFWKILAHKQTVENKQAILQADSGHSSSAEQTGTRSMSCHVQNHNKGWRDGFQLRVRLLTSWEANRLLVCRR